MFNSWYVDLGGNMVGMVDIILASYNGEKYIREQIESIMGSSYKDFRLFVCDDCSTDSTRDIVNEYVSAYPDKVYLSVNDKNLGSTASFLTNLKRISREHPAAYYMFCDQDDSWLSDKIAIAVKHIRHIERRRGSFLPTLVFSDAIIVDENLNFIHRSFYKTNRLKVRRIRFSRMLIENKCQGCTMLMNASLVNMLVRTGPEIRYHDWWMALIASGFGIVRFNKTPTVLYRQHGDNQVGQADFASYAKDRAGRREDVRERLRRTYDQAQLFYAIYADRLPKNKRKHLQSFIRLKDAGFFKRRFIILKNRFFKSGFLRNIGLLFYV